MASWKWSVGGIAENYGGTPKGFGAEGFIEADNGEHALNLLLQEMPGPWDELDSYEEFTVTIKPVEDNEIGGLK